MPVVVLVYSIRFEISMNKHSPQPPAQRNPKDAFATDPGLLKRHSRYKSYHVPSTGLTCPSIWTFYGPHPYADKLPSKAEPLPLLVFIHGLGGSATHQSCQRGTMPVYRLTRVRVVQVCTDGLHSYTTAALVDLLATLLIHVATQVVIKE